MEEGLVVVLLADVEGSTDQLPVHEELMRSQVALHQGREVRMLRDGFLAVFTSVRRGLVCAAGIQRALAEHAARAPDDHVRLRVGLTAGELTEDHGDVLGAAVNAAADICSQARGGEILVASVVRELAGTVPGITFMDRGWVRRRGSLEDTHLYQVTWQMEVPGGPGPPRTALVGRDAEMATLQGLMEASLRGHGAVVTLGGEPGVGKSRLAEEIAGAAARKGMLALTGHCDETAGASPHAPFVEIIEATVRTLPRERLRTTLGRDAAEVAKIVPDLHRVLPDIPPPVTIPAEHERGYLFNSVCDFVARTAFRRPLLLVLEDLHWADEATLALLRHLAEKVGDLAVLIVATYRDVEINADHSLAGTLEWVTRHSRCHHIPVRRLPQAAVAAMLRDLTSQDPPDTVVAVIHAETEGNPFFVEEMVQYLADEGRLFDAEGRLRRHVVVGDTDVPDRVRLVLGRRLARLSENTRRVLTAAATIGRGFGVELLRALVEVDGDAWLDAMDQAEHARLLLHEEGPPARYSFAHELIRQTLLTGTSLARRQRLHLRVAEVIEEISAPTIEDHAAEMAHHLVQAGALADPQRTVRFLTLTADRAMAAAAFEDALQHARTALDLVPGGDRRRRAELMERIAQALRRTGRWDQAREVWWEAVAAYEDLGDGEAVVRLCWDMARQLLWTGRFAEMQEVVRRGLDALEERHGPWRTQLLLISGLGFSISGDHAPGDALTREAVDRAGEHGGGVLATALVGRCVHHWYWGELREVVEQGLRGAEACRSIGELWTLADALGFLQQALAILGRLEDAARVGQELHPLASRLGHLAALRWTGRAEAPSRVATGDLEGFERTALDDLALCQKTGMPWSSDAYIRLGVVAFWRGQWDQALHDVDQADERELPGSVLHGTAHAFQALLRAYRRDRREVLAMLEARRRELPIPGQPHHLGAWTCLLVLPEALAVVGAGKDASAFYPLVLEAVESGAVFRVCDAALVQMVAGICAAAGEDWARAEEHYRTALWQAEQIPHRIAQPEVRRWFAEMLLDRDRRGRHDEAVQLLEQAVEGYRAVAMPRHLQMAEALLARARGG